MQTDRIGGRIVLLVVALAALILGAAVAHAAPLMLDVRSENRRVLVPGPGDGTMPHCGHLLWFQVPSQDSQLQQLLWSQVSRKNDSQVQTHPAKAVHRRPWSYRAGAFVRKQYKRLLVKSKSS